MKANLWISTNSFIYINMLSTDKLIESCINPIILTPTLVTYWQTAHLTDGAPYGYIKVVQQCPQVIWEIWLDAITCSQKLSKQAGNHEGEKREKKLTKHKKPINRIARQPGKPMVWDEWGNKTENTVRFVLTPKFD